MQHILSPVFVIGKVDIDTIEGASCLNMGNNWPTNFRSTKKHNQGFGQVSGDRHVLSGLRSLLNDPDTYDAMSIPSDTTPAWLEQLLGPAGVQEFDHDEQSSKGESE